MTKILHLVPAYTPSKGGIEILLSSLIPIIRKSNLESIVVTDSSVIEYAKSRIENTDVYRIPFTAVSTLKPFDLRKMLESLSKLKEIIDTTEPEILHIHGATFVSSWFATRVISKNDKIKIVVTQHGVLEKGDSTKAFKQLIDRSSALVGVSKAVLDSAAPKQDFRNRIYTVIPNGVALDETERVNWPLVSQIKILLIGRLDFEKGFDIGINAASMLNKYFSTSVLIIGDGEFKEEFEKLALSLKLDLIIISCVENSTVQAYIREASFVWVTSRTREGFSLAAAESGINGIPVICSSTGGLPETVIDGITGGICKTNESSSYVQKTLEFMQQSFDPTGIINDGISINIKKLSRSRFSLTNCAESYIGIYRKVAHHAGI